MPPHIFPVVQNFFRATLWCLWHKRKRAAKLAALLPLSYEDSNLDRQNQKLQCYHYTIRQS